MKLVPLLFALLLATGAEARSRRGNCDQRIKAAFEASRGGGFLIPEHHYAPKPGSCGDYFGRACGQFIVPYSALYKALGKDSVTDASRVNEMLGTNLQPGNYYLMYVNTSATSLRLRCPKRAELHDRDQDGECATKSDCGCNPKFVDGEGRTSGNIVEGFVEGLNRRGGYCSAVRKVTLR